MVNSVDSITQVIDNNKCSNPTCDKESKLQCPTCLTLKLSTPSTFCSQTCFKSYWTVHKLYHDKINQLEKPKADLSIPPQFKGYQFTGPLRPTNIVTPMRTVPKHILLPDYAVGSIPISERDAYKRNAPIVVLKKDEIELMRELGKMGREVLDIAGNAAKIGVTTEEIDVIVHNAVVERGCYPSPLNYYKFPKSCCTSLNEVICHGIPDLRPLRDGDILNVDVSLYWKGYHIDLNETYLIGDVDEEGKALVKTAYDCLEKAIAMCKPGVMYREVGDVIQKHADSQKFSVVKNFVGHGIGKLFHSAPNVPHYGKNKQAGVMKVGHCFTIEPMINTKSHLDEFWPDAWTAVTIDGGRSAQFEQTLLITETGCEVLTKRTRGSYIDRHF